MTWAERGIDRDRLRIEQELREAETVLAHLRGLTLDEAARALKADAVLAGTSVIAMARGVIAHRPVVRPRVLTPVTDLEWWAATGLGTPTSSVTEGRIPSRRTHMPRTD